MSDDKPLRQDILTLMDSFIEQIQQVSKIFLGVSVSAMVLAPLALILSLYLILHPSFFVVLEIENEFGLILGILLVSVVVISALWLLTGIRQYRSMSAWKNRYREYSRQKEEMDKKIASQFNLDQE